MTIARKVGMVIYFRFDVTIRVNRFFGDLGFGYSEIKEIEFGNCCDGGGTEGKTALSRGRVMEAAPSTPASGRALV